MIISNSFVSFNPFDVFSWPDSPQSVQDSLNVPKDRTVNIDTNRVKDSEVENSSTPVLSLKKEEMQRDLSFVNARTQRLFDLYFRTTFSIDYLSRVSLDTVQDLPKLEKIILHWSGKKVLQEKKQILPACVALFVVTGQKFQWTVSRHSIAAFKLRKDSLLGCKVTLRGRVLSLFLEKSLYFLLPRLRQGDFLSPGSFQSNGTFQGGITEIFLFPELETHFESFETLGGFQMTFVFSQKHRIFKERDNAGFLLLNGFQWIRT